MKKLMTKHKRLAYKKKTNLEITTSGAYVVEKKTELSFLILKFTGKINERSEMAIKLNWNRKEWVTRRVYANVTKP